MPLYDYKCAKGHVFEELQSWSSDPVADCNICGEPAKRQVSIPMVVYKGSGFYTTDYARNGSSNGSSKSDSESKSNGESKSSNSKDSSKAGSSSKKESASTSADRS